MNEENNVNQETEEKKKKLDDIFKITVDPFF